MLVFLALALPAFAEPISVEACYEKFSRYSPKDIVALTEQAKAQILEDPKKALEHYNQLNKDSFPDPPHSPVVTIVRCDEMRGEAFFMDNMRAAFQEKNYLRKFQDVEGKHPFVELCAKLKGNIKGAWTLQTHYWIDCDGPLRMGVLFLKVPGTPYVVQSSLPSKTLSLADYEKSLAP
ncbi:MAG: hypothetical protein A2508_00935 [Candidatus Lambdaproteobacteria bacterium RIFOXYD12_FULL_49_8]|nr:MAG: hypothetical protein A2508_00935 [Candidatus Lambdaproteobacteria bacterium RIFOXYD12_FULL_49_8]